MRDVGWGGMMRDMTFCEMREIVDNEKRRRAVVKVFPVRLAPSPFACLSFSRSLSLCLSLTSSLVSLISRSHLSSFSHQKLEKHAKRYWQGLSVLLLRTSRKRKRERGKNEPNRAEFVLLCESC